MNFKTLDEKITAILKIYPMFDREFIADVVRLRDEIGFTGEFRLSKGESSVGKLPDKGECRCEVCRRPKKRRGRR